jgi:hypothetical protein
MTPTSPILSAMLSEPEPCDCLLRVVAFFAGETPVLLVDGLDGTSALDCQKCGVRITYEHFARLVMSAMQEKN